MKQSLSIKSAYVIIHDLREEGPGTSGVPNTYKTTWSIPSPNANKSSCFSLPKQKNCSLNSDTGLSPQILVIQSLKTATNTHWYRFTSTHYKLTYIALSPCTYAHFKYTLMPPEIPFLLDLKKPVTTYHSNFTAVCKSDFQYKTSRSSAHNPAA